MVHVEDGDKRSVMVSFGADSQNGNAPSGESKTTFINESGLYSLIFGSKLEGAVRFKRWVTSRCISAGVSTFLWRPRASRQRYRHVFHSHTSS